MTPTDSPILNAAGGQDLAGAAASAGQFLLMAVIIIVVLYGAHIATKHFARLSLPKRGRNLEVIDSLPVGQFTALQIVRAGTKYVLLGVTKERISLLTELDDDELSLDGLTDKKPVAFEDYLSKLFPRRGKNNSSGDAGSSGIEDKHED